MKRKYQLDQEEQEILDALNSGALELLKDAKTEIAQLVMAAKAYGNKVRGDSLIT